MNENEKLKQEVAKLQQRLVDANSLKNRVKDGLIGAIISFFVVYVAIIFLVLFY